MIMHLLLVSQVRRKAHKDCDLWLVKGLLYGLLDNDNDNDNDNANANAKLSLSVLNKKNTNVIRHCWG